MPLEGIKDKLLLPLRRRVMFRIEITRLTQAKCHTKQNMSVLTK